MCEEQKYICYSRRLLLALNYCQTCIELAILHALSTNIREYVKSFLFFLILQASVRHFIVASSEPPSWQLTHEFGDRQRVCTMKELFIHPSSQAKLPTAVRVLITVNEPFEVNKLLLSVLISVINISLQFKTRPPRSTYIFFIKVIYFFFTGLCVFFLIMLFPLKKWIHFHR